MHVTTACSSVWQAGGGGCRGLLCEGLVSSGMQVLVLTSVNYATHKTGLHLVLHLVFLSSSSMQQTAQHRAAATAATCPPPLRAACAR
jgi:hypothetical protein